MRTENGQKSIGEDICPENVRKNAKKINKFLRDRDKNPVFILA